MHSSERVKLSQDSDSNQLDFAINLFSQQIWCWGRDILRTEGNWLLEIGFSRQPPPVERADCASLYFLDLPNHRRVILRGFGVFFCDPKFGTVFLPRYEFFPKYCAIGKLDTPPWSDDDIPCMECPTNSQRNNCAMLMLELVDWIRSYEKNIAEQLGVGHRRDSLTQWDNGKRMVIPAEAMTAAWRELSILIAGNFDLFLTRQRV